MAHGGGAGKVYFVLYLAVVLELLIIIVERDEAEEGLHRKQKETMRIVESILSQLYSGSGSEGIGTRPQDEITFPPPGINVEEVMKTKIQTWRQYNVDVGVTDISQGMKRLEGETEKDYYLRLFELAERGNVEDLEYQIFYNPSQDAANAPQFPSEFELKKNKDDEFVDVAANTPVPGTGNDANSPWTFLAYRKLVLDKEKTKDAMNLSNISMSSFEPFYNIINNSKDASVAAYAPPGVTDDSIFAYSKDKTFQGASISGRDTSLKKRTFLLNFQPPNKSGWYKLRLVSHTNAILGVRKDVDPLKLDDETNINIGSVKLKVGDLRKVIKELQSKLEEYALPSMDILQKDPLTYEEGINAAISNVPGKADRQDIIGQIKLYRYISKLLTPGAYRDFDQNHSAMEFNVRVITPAGEKAPEPVIYISDQQRFDAAPEQVFDFQISPNREESKITGSILNSSGDPVPNVSVTFEKLRTDMDVVYMRGHIQGQLYASQDNRSPSEYKIKLRHEIGGRIKDTTATLMIYPAVDKLTNDDLKGFFEGRASYGKKLSFSFQPSSGKKISEEQFRIYVKLDDKIDSIPGYVMPEDRNFIFPATATTASLRIVWIDPVTHVSVDVFPEDITQIKQLPPTISFNQIKTDYAGTEKQLIVRISGIAVISPSIGSSDESKKAEVSVDAAMDKADVRVQGFQLIGKPSITKQGEFYTLQFNIAGSIPPSARGRIQGTANITIGASAKNPISGKESKRTTRSYQADIDYRPAKK